MTAIDRFKYTGHDRSLSPVSVKEDTDKKGGSASVL